jgi:protein ImuA
MKIVSRTALLWDLQRRVGAVSAQNVMEKGASLDQPPICFGLDALNQALPWGGLNAGALHEISASDYRDRPAAAGFTLGLATRILTAKSISSGNSLNLPHILWVRLERGFQDFGDLYGPGLAQLGLDPGQVIVASARDEADVLWAMEEGLHCTGLAGVIGEVRAGAKAYDLTASRRLNMAAEAAGIPALVMRQTSSVGASSVGRGADNMGGSSAAASRWSVAASHSAPLDGIYRKLATAIGHPRWRVALTRCRDGGKPHHWILEWNHETHRFRMATPVADRQVLPSATPEPARAFPDRGPDRRPDTWVSQGDAQQGKILTG